MFYVRQMSLYLQFLNCASRNCLVLILCSLLSPHLLLHPAVTVKSGFILPYDFNTKKCLESQL